MQGMRRFPFFDKDLVTTPISPTEIPFFEKLKLKCATSGRGSIILSEEGSGIVSLVDQSFQAVQFQAYDQALEHMQLACDRNILVTVGRDSNSESTIVKLWNMGTRDSSGAPNLVSQIQVDVKGSYNIPVNCLAVTPDISHIALGMVNGIVISITGDLMRDKGTKVKKIAAYQNSIIGLSFKSQPPAMHLFVATIDAVVVVTLHANSEPAQVILDPESSGQTLAPTTPPTCVTMSDDKQFVVGKDEAIYFYDTEGKGGCSAFEGNKKLMTWFRGYLIVVGPQPIPEHQRASPIAAAPRADILTIYDLKNKFIAYPPENQTTKDNWVISHVVSEWGKVYVFTQEGKVYRLEEKDMQTKLELLFKKNLFNIAIDLASSQKADNQSSIVTETYKKHGDHLYSKGDFDGAIDQYVKTIGTLEPSYVIMKFLDAQRIKNLTKYLQQLHKEGRANADHTTLLLNCYTKLKKESKLSKFLQNDSSEAIFDIETAIKVCRQAGYFDNALFLAKKKKQHEWYLKILIEDKADYDLALDYIESLPFAQAESNMKKYGKTLVTAVPEKATKLIMNLCLNYTPVALPTAASPPTSQSTSTASIFAAAASTTSTAASAASSLLSSLNPLTQLDKASGSISAALDLSGLPPIVIGPLVTNNTASTTPTAPGTSVPAAPALSSSISVATKVEAIPKRVERANPEEFIHLFVDRPGSLIAFLEFITARCPSDSSLMYDTLLELYLRELSESVSVPSPENTGTTATTSTTTTVNLPEIPTMETSSASLTADEKSRRAFNLLTDPSAHYDPDHALVLCQTYGFKQGVLYLLEKLQLYHEIIQYYMENEDYEPLIKACAKYGEKDSNLWIEVLSFLSSRPNCQQYVEEVLSMIDQPSTTEYEQSHARDDQLPPRSLVPPLMVIQILAQKPTTTLGVVKDYISRILNQENKILQADLVRIRTLKEETEKMQTEIEELRTAPRIFQLSKCSSCQNPLELPAVHFLCMHSFHQRCLSDEQGCPVCTPTNREIVNRHKALLKDAHDHKTFFWQLDQTPDGFTTVSDYFGRGIFQVLQEPGSSTGASAAASQTTSTTASRTRAGRV
ncbi:Vacuolar protein sorting-associated protein 11 [Pelomyxa schiedti]|nr:Vacuolar protein sorting-associated protein 11 [Pelomyxa schiedti]